MLLLPRPQVLQLEALYLQASLQIHPERLLVWIYLLLAPSPVLNRSVCSCHWNTQYAAVYGMLNMQHVIMAPAYDQGLYAKHTLYAPSVTVPSICAHTCLGQQVACDSAIAHQKANTA